MRWRFIVFSVTALVVVLGVVGYLGAVYIVYNRLSSVGPRCESHPDYAAFTPDAFTVTTYNPDIDVTPYLMPDYEEVTLPSRDRGLSISGWYMPVDEPDAPAVILVHGLSACKRAPEILLSAGMLHRNGFNTLAIDLRDMGDSEIEDGRYAGGTEEYLDVLGAYDWLVAEKGIAPDAVGLFGTSLGAATVLIAAGEEPRIAAVWEDSSYADVQTAIVAELERGGYPTWLMPGGLLLARIVAGDDFTTLSPIGGVRKLNGRPLFITHGDADNRLSVEYAYDLAEAAQANGDTVQMWIAPGSGHTQAVFDHPEEYEQRLVAFFREALDGENT